jgi:hypothetical protein
MLLSFSNLGWHFFKVRGHVMLLCQCGSYYLTTYFLHCSSIKWCLKCSMMPSASKREECKWLWAETLLSEWHTNESNTPMACLALVVGASVMKRSRSNVRAKGFVRDFWRHALLSMWQALIFTYILKPVYKMVWRYDRTYSWIYWRMKEIDIVDLFLPI